MGIIVNGRQLTSREEKAFLDFAALSPYARQSWGRRQIVSMNGLAAAGVVVRVKRGGADVGWDLTDAGQAAVLNLQDRDEKYRVMVMCHRETKWIDHHRLNHARIKDTR